MNAVSAASVKRSPGRALKVAGSAVLLGAMALAVLAFTSNPSSTTPTTAPENFSVSTPVPSPIGVTEVPRSTAPTVPPSPVPVVVLAEAEQPSPTRVVEQARLPELRRTGSSFSGGGSGNSGSGNGYGNVSRGDDNGNSNGARGAGDRKTGNGNNGNGNGSNGTRTEMEGTVSRNSRLLRLFPAVSGSLHALALQCWCTCSRVRRLRWSIAVTVADDAVPPASVR